MIELPQAHYRISMKALIYDENGKFLLSRESDGRWDMPGGWLDHGEHPIVWLKRELMEEMWLEVTWIAKAPKYFITANRILSAKTPWVANVCYEVTVKNLDFTPSSECEQIGFFTPEEALQLRLFENVEVLCHEMISQK